MEAVMLYPHTDSTAKEFALILGSSNPSDVKYEIEHDEPKQSMDKRLEAALLNGWCQHQARGQWLNECLAVLWVLELFLEGKRTIEEDDVVDCITSQANAVKSTHPSIASSIRKRKLVESSPEKESPSVKSSMAYEDLVRFVCSNSKQGSSSDDNFDLVGKNVAMKLRSMDATQNALAERLIGEILFQGQMEMLAVNTTITTPNTNNITTSTPLRSIVINAGSTIQTRREVQEQPKTTYIITPHDSTES